MTDNESKMNQKLSTLTRDNFIGQPRIIIKTIGLSHHKSHQRKTEVQEHKYLAYPCQILFLTMFLSRNPKTWNGSTRIV